MVDDTAPRSATPDEPRRTDAPAGFVPQRPSGLSHLRDALSAKPSRGQVVVAVLVGVMGFVAVEQFRASEEDLLARARRADLVQILDGLTQRSERLESQVRDLLAAPLHCHSKNTTTKAANASNKLFLCSGEIRILRNIGSVISSIGYNPTQFNC